MAEAAAPASTEVPAAVTTAASAPATTTPAAAPAAPAQSLINETPGAATSTAAAVTPPPLADVTKYLTDKGTKPEDLAKLDEAAQRAKYDELKAAEKPAPVEYKEFKLPEGVKFDEKKIAEFKTFAASKNLSQEDAQGLVDMHAAQLQAAAKAPYDLWNETQTKWRAEINADPVIGGANLAPAMIEVGRLIDHLKVPGLREAMNFTGAGNNPAIVRAFVEASKLLPKEGTPTTPGKPTGGKPGQTAAEKIYGGQQSAATT